MRLHRSKAVTGAARIASIPPMALLNPVPPPYDIQDWLKKPFPERVKMVCQSWALQGYGTPWPIYLVYILKIFVDYRNMIEMDPGVLVVPHFSVQIIYGPGALRLELLPLGTRYGDQSERTGVLESPDNAFHHRQI